MEYSNLLKIISKIRNILYYYWFFIAHRSPNYRSLLSACESHGSNIHMKERIVAVEDRSEMKEDCREHTTVGKTCAGDVGFVLQYDIWK